MNGMREMRRKADQSRREAVVAGIHAQPPRQARGLSNLPRRNKFMLAAAVAVIVLVFVAAFGGRNAGNPSGDASTVTYVVNGSPADVTYGPAGSEFSGSVPMDATASLGNPAYYAINAQLQGGGLVTCKILVNGQVISQGQATGSYHIAQCEISQGPDGWESDN